MHIPRIIHQVWEGHREPQIPTRLKILSETWKEKNPSWEYRLWGKNEMDELLRTHFADFEPTYREFKHDVQRWDAIRYMILYIYGGVYTDLDTECYRSIDTLLEDKEICIGLEPDEHIHQGYPKPFIGNAFMCSISSHVFWLDVLHAIKQNVIANDNIKHKGTYVLSTTGPLMMSETIAKYKSSKKIDLLLAKDVAPVSKFDMIDMINGNTKKFENKIKDAYCAHYFFGSWEENFSLYKTYEYA